MSKENRNLENLIATPIVDPFAKIQTDFLGKENKTERVEVIKKINAKVKEKQSVNSAFLNNIANTRDYYRFRLDDSLKLKLEELIEFKRSQISENFGKKNTYIKSEIINKLLEISLDIILNNKEGEENE